MPEYKFYTKHHLEVALRMIGEAAYVEISPLTIRGLVHTRAGALRRPLHRGATCSLVG